MGMIKYFVEKVVNPVLRKMGGEFVPNLRAPSLTSALARIVEKNIEVQTVIDIGASYGKWSQDVRRFYPNAFYLLIEAQKVHEMGLQSFKARHDNSDFVLAAAGDCIGEVYFDESDPFGGLASHTPLQGNGRRVTRVPVTTVDAEVNARKLKPPYLLKLDTHGFEVPIFKGAPETLKKTSLIIVETYNFTIADGSLRFHKMCAFLESRGFRPIDLCDPLFRPKDGILWQFDLFFARTDRREFQSNTYE